jgi:hypothetical protein
MCSIRTCHKWRAFKPSPDSQTRAPPHISLTPVIGVKLGRSRKVCIIGTWRIKEGPKKPGYGSIYTFLKYMCDLKRQIAGSFSSRRLEL